MYCTQINISSTLSCLRTFKQAYKEENGVINIGDIRDLIDKIDLIESCVNKQKEIPTDNEKEFSLFGKMKWNHFCPSCGAVFHKENGQFCSKCGQKCC